jgi:hypothetical protein
MSVSSLIDRIAPYAKGWSRNGSSKSILQLIQQGQDELFDYDSPAMIFIPTNNQGYPPYLTTVAGTLRYDITNANLQSDLSVAIGGASRTVRCKRVTKIFVDTTMVDYTVKQTGQPYMYSFPNRWYAAPLDRLQVSDIPMSTYPALEGTPAYVQLVNDPGASTDKYFVEFVWEPPRLTSESIPLVVPQSYEKALMWYCIGEIQCLENGKTNEFQQLFKAEQTEFRSKMGLGVQHTTNETQPIFC